MYAIVEIAGKQYRVEKEKRIKVPFLSTEPGKEVHFDRVLMYRDEKGDVVIGKPVVEKINVSALVIGHGREKKIIVYKKKRRKGYQRKKGHRQDFTLLEITDIGTGPRLEKKAESTREVKPVDIEKAVPVEAKDKPASAKKTEHKPAPAKTKTVREIKKTKTPDIKKKTTAEKKPAPAKKVTDKKKPAGNKK
jgi:large subunit ribosomal protein L21